MHKNVFKVTREFYKFLHLGRASFSAAQKAMSGVDKAVSFKDFSRPNKEIKYFSRTWTEFKDLSRWPLKFKTF